MGVCASSTQYQNKVVCVCGASNAGKTNLIDRISAWHREAEGQRAQGLSAGWAFSTTHTLSSYPSMGQSSELVVTPSGQNWELVEVSGGQKIYPLWAAAARALPLCSATLSAYAARRGVANTDITTTATVTSSPPARNAAS